MSRQAQLRVDAGTQSRAINCAVHLSKPLSDAKEALRAVLTKMPRTDIRKEDGPYLHVEFRTAVMRFVDDVEFLFDEQTKTLQFRSASRVGYSDWNVNRKRMEEIRNQMLGKM
ncbi:MAG: DUF1499 domain-containing protein [Bdellovibrionales bacterium]|nr:DUF1499 domain-containing protein [Bdellovibrionales bacterium]